MRALKSRRAMITQASPRRREQKLHRQEEILKAAFDVFALMGMKQRGSMRSQKRPASQKGQSTFIFGIRIIFSALW